tara:strand:- start:535 stop:1836 length:1302 start_codon:yes stop_codon:yes gene_type:complete
MNTSNDGAHIGLAKSIYYEHQFNVEKYLDVYVSHPDYAVKDNQIFSDRLPGMASLIIPAFAYANVLKGLGFSTANETNELDIVIASILPPLFGLLSAILLFWYYYKILRKKFSISIICTVIYAFATLAWLESSHLFSHAPSLLFVSLAVLIVISDFKKINWQKQLIISSMLLGFASLIELQNFLFFFPLLGYIIYKNNLLKKEFRNQLVKYGVLTGIIIIVFICGILAYNYMVFEEFTLKSNKFNPFFPEEKSFMTSLSGNILQGLDNLYTSFTNIEAYVNPLKARLNDIPGIFVTSPVMILSVIGFFFFYKKHKAKAIVLLSCIFIATLIAAMHVTTLVRHFYTVNLFLFLPFIFFIEYIYQKENKGKKNWLLIGTCIFVLISFIRVFFSAISYWGRNFDNLFLYKEELLLFFIANIPLILILFFFRAYRKQ